jgi:hypothetical protein
MDTNSRRTRATNWRLTLEVNIVEYLGFEENRRDE